MKGSPKRQALEEALKYEKAGSSKIQALSHYGMRKDVEWRTEQRPAIILTIPFYAFGSFSCGFPVYPP